MITPWRTIVISRTARLPRAPWVAIFLGADSEELGELEGRDWMHLVAQMAEWCTTTDRPHTGRPLERWLCWLVLMAWIERRGASDAEQPGDDVYARAARQFVATWGPL